MSDNTADIQQVTEIFTDLGGTFITAPDEIASRLTSIKAVVYDWDGVFNAGFKGEGQPSSFNEADSMGTNMLRFGLWRRNNTMPIAAIISGEQNETARYFATREHFHHLYLGIPDKRTALAHLCESFNIEPTNVAFVFDDVNDLGMAAQCGLRMMVKRNASPLLQRYAASHDCCDYITANSSLEYAVRETVEFMLGFCGQFNSTIDARIQYDKSYQQYFSQRQAIETQHFRADGSSIAST